MSVSIYDLIYQELIVSRNGNIEEHELPKNIYKMTKEDYKEIKERYGRDLKLFLVGINCDYMSYAELIPVYHTSVLVLAENEDKAREVVNHVIEKRVHSVCKDVWCAPDFPITELSV